MNKIIKIIVILLILLSPVPLTLALSSYDLAAASGNISNPDSDPAISDSHWNRNVITTGDKVLYFQYYIPYGTIPGVLASQTFHFDLVADNGTTVGVSVPFPYFYNGYNYGVSSFYFAANNTALTWGDEYTINVAESASWFISSKIYNGTLIPTTAYSSYNATADNQAEMASNVISLARNLQNYTGTTLLEYSGSGQILSVPAGQDYFRGAIYGLQAMAPTLFLVQVVTLDANLTGWVTTQFDTYEAQWSGTWIGSAVSTTGTQFGLTSAEVMGIGFIGILIFAVIIASAIKWKQIEPGLLISVGLIIMGAQMGWIPPAIFASVNQILGFYVAYLWMGARA